MTDTWDRTLFDKDLKAILETKLPVSASKITALQSLATAHPQHHNYIVQCITRFIENAPPDYRLAGLYVIDAISRVVHKQQRKREDSQDGRLSDLEGYLKRFSIVLRDDALKGCFEPCSAKDKEKVRKTLDFWEQGNLYSKDLVQYLKTSFLNSKQVEQHQKVTPPPVDTASLLATLSTIGNGSLANLTIPGLTPTPAPPQVQSPTNEQDKNALPPALAKLLGGLVSTPATASSTPASPTSSVSDPRVRNDPRMASVNNELTQPKNWPPPQGPSIPARASTERKSRWSNANDNTNPTLNQSAHDPWSQRQGIQDPRMPPQAPNYLPAYQQSNPVPSYQQPNPPQSYQQPNPTQPYQQSNPTQPYQQPLYHTQPTYHSPYQQPQEQRISSEDRGTEPTHDPSLPPGCIRVLTRTLFVGPIPDHYERDDVAQLFMRYGELASVIVSKKIKGRHNAFLKFTTRASTEAAKYNSVNLIVQDVPVKVNWAFGFGPKKHFNYDRGDSIIPLSELSTEEKENLVTAPLGGFQGQPVRERMVIEEPEAQYRPEWKNNDEPRGTKRFYRPGFQHEDNNKRGRFQHEDNRQNFYPQFQPSYQPYDPSSMIPYSNQQ
ncbi:Rpb7-binding protein seb1 [Choanephora cucurbitarum]|uniref:Rpb7-binding protein seb1 n=1 Tax=Choanephora cucurbitarum TaxID=101091 RepID=A0A1C7NRE1_9FUNG|nr:Rpb7-binding protein seb1 [Choanephora cucurbitarum]